MTQATTMATDGGQGMLSPKMAARVFACLAGGYLISYSLRAINAAIAPELVAEFGLTNATLGYLSSAYFLAFALMQLPLGVWLDRFGTRRVNASLLLVAAGGCAVFALASDATALWIGRALIGAGLAGALMSSLRVFRFWFPADRQPQLVAMMLVAGSSGALLATTPSRWALPLLGWRGLFVVGALGLVAASVAIFLLLPRHEPASARTPAGAKGQGFAGYLGIFSSAYFWRFVLLAIILHSGFIAFQSLWAGPWLTQVLGMAPSAAGNALFLLNLVLLGAFLALGSTVRQLTRRGLSVVQMCKIVTVLIIGLHLWLSVNDSVVVGVGIWLVYAVLTTPYTLLQSHVSLSFPEHLTGRAFTAYNLFLFGGIFLVQWLFGVLVDWCTTWSVDEAQGFRRAMQVWVGLEALALLWVLLFRATPPVAGRVAAGGR